MNKKMKEKIEAIVKEICDKSLFKNKLHKLSSGELACASPIFPVLYVYTPQNNEPAARKIDMRLLNDRDYVCIETFLMERTYDYDTPKKNVIKDYLEFQNKTLLNFLNLLYGGKCCQIEGYDVKKRFKNGNLWGYQRQIPYPLVERNTKELIIHEELGLVFSGEPHYKETKEMIICGEPHEE